jgi:pilus assembly protein Flp/PilA
MTAISEHVPSQPRQVIALKSAALRHVVRMIFGGVMRKALQVIKKLGKDEDGAALVEYTVLLGIMLVAVISTIVLVGGWVNTKWTALYAALQATN